MPTDTRILVRRNRDGKIVRILTIHAPRVPGSADAAADASALPLASKPLLQEVSSTELEALLKELEEQQKKK